MNESIICMSVEDSSNPYQPRTLEFKDGDVIRLYDILNSLPTDEYLKVYAYQGKLSIINIYSHALAFNLTDNPIFKGHKVLPNHAIDVPCKHEFRLSDRSLITLSFSKKQQAITQPAYNMGNWQTTVSNSTFDTNNRSRATLSASSVSAPNLEAEGIIAEAKKQAEAIIAQAKESLSDNIAAEATRLRNNGNSSAVIGKYNAVYEELRKSSTDMYLALENTRKDFDNFRRELTTAPVQELLEWVREFDEIWSGLAPETVGNEQSEKVNEAFRRLSYLRKHLLAKLNNFGVTELTVLKGDRYDAVLHDNDHPDSYSGAEGYVKACLYSGFQLGDEILLKPLVVTVKRREGING